MSVDLVKPLSARLFIASVPLALVSASIATPPLRASLPTDPLRFFEGRTEYVGTMKLIARKSYRSHSLGHGQIDADGALHLVQKVREGSKPPFERRWHIRNVGPGRFTGTMSQARGPVKVDAIDGRYRFRFRMKGGVSVEQWLTPVSQDEARSRLTVRKLGIKVGRSEGVIRKI